MAYTLSDVQPKIVNGVVVELSDAEKQATVDEWNAPDTRPYFQKRIEEYPSIGDQLDMLWHAIDGDATLKSDYADFHTALKAVKDANPK